MTRNAALIITLALLLLAPTMLLAEKAPESKDSADHVVTAHVEAIYTRTRTVDADTPFETKRTEYVIELNVLEVHKGKDARKDKHFHVHCFKRIEPTDGSTPPPGMGGHWQIPQEGQTIKAYTRFAHKQHKGIYPTWFEVVK